ncbi:MAG: prolyl oligopeptidase family serine peptidase [Gammaproteobacteria bacterium]|nr:prolyl oligopeptidase family serine peptidase [Gammaproteobacteria bacterium]MDH4255326.1 prolyl oligopeptidase family serine peptidase [Gammaproteobacteria bacterium]MDH5311355.1 prolyl oligopeptidase family serine peptidase [Gammaproteobacteria bacterium]
MGRLIRGRLPGPLAAPAVAGLLAASALLSWIAPAAAQSPDVTETLEPAVFVFTEPVQNSDIPVDITLIETVDGLYTALGLRRPKGRGPFPIVLFFTGNGGGGVPWVRHQVNHRAYTMERFLEAGYAVGWLRYRAEVWFEYTRVPKLEVSQHLAHQLLNRPPLEYDDLKTIVEYVRTLPYVDPDRVGLVGNSHGGGMILKATAEMDVAAAIASEPDATEVLQMDPTKFGADAEYRDMASVAPYLNKDVAMDRFRRIRTPILMMGRSDDHLQGIFETAYAWMKEAGVNVEWVSHDHPVHGYLIRIPKEDGVFQPDDIQLEAIAEALEFFGRYMPPSGQAAN